MTDLDAVGIVGMVEEDEEGQTLLRQLLRVLERDLTHQRVALLRYPRLDISKGLMSNFPRTFYLQLTASYVGSHYIVWIR